MSAGKHRAPRRRWLRRRSRDPFSAGFYLAANLPDGRTWSQPIGKATAKALLELGVPRR